MDFIDSSGNTRDRFVGLFLENDVLNASFPLGFNPSNDRGKDIFLLADIFRLFGKSLITASTSGLYKNYFYSSFPFYSYALLIEDYLKYGCLFEKDRSYSYISTKGKPCWSQTIKRVRPELIDGNAVYLKRVTYKTLRDRGALISKIHEYCLKKSFEKIGFLYLKRMPTFSSYKLDKNLFCNTLLKAIRQTFNDRESILLRAMLSVIKQESSNDRSVPLYGTYRFEYLWQSMVDYCYGISNKKIYFPKSDWKINGKVLTNHFHPLQPDSIMLCNGELFILDSKYYQFGVSLKIDDLPSTSDVSKQVVYGKYARKKFSGKVFNAFILPFNAATSNSSPMQACGETMISPYFEFQPSESRVKLVLVDTRMLMENYSLRKKGNIKELAKTIKSDV